MIAALARTFRRLTALPLDNPELLKAQHSALTRQMPVFYFVLLVSTWSLAATYVYSAPLWLTVGVSGVLTLVSLIRMIGWWRSRNQLPNIPRIIHQLTVTCRIAALMSASFCLWAYSLYPYGGSYAQAHVVCFMIIMVIACIFCTMHVRPAALVSTVILNLAFVSFFAFSGNPVFIVLSINYVLVSVAMLIVMQNHYRDFARLAELQATANRLANEDSLTGLPNRRQFFVALDTALRHSRQEGRRLAVAILDLDGFKPVNDLYGHGIGDRLLVQVGQRLKKLANEGTQVARLGGDEFALLFTDGHDDATLQALGSALCADLRVPYLVVEVPIQISASLGIATFPDMADTADQIYEFADYALYQSKRRKTGGECLFSPQLREQLLSEAEEGQGLLKVDVED